MSKQHIQSDINLTDAATQAVSVTQTIVLSSVVMCAVPCGT